MGTGIHLFLIRGLVTITNGMPVCLAYSGRAAPSRAADQL